MDLDDLLGKGHLSQTPLRQDAVRNAYSNPAQPKKSKQSPSHEPVHPFVVNKWCDSNGQRLSKGALYDSVTPCYYCPLSHISWHYGFRTEFIQMLAHTVAPTASAMLMV